MPRLFSAIELPEDVRSALSDLDAPLPGARWIADDDMHITLRFAGDIDKRQARDFADALSLIEIDAFEIRISGVGAFGGNDPRVLWAGVEGGPALDALARASERAARQAGLPPEKRNFKPHVTLARLRGTPVDLVARYLQRHGAFKLEPFLVDRFVLFSSKPQVGGGPYVIEETYPLRGAVSDDAHDDRPGW